MTFKIPPVRIPLNIKDQHATISVSGLITLLRKAHGLNVLHLDLNADLSDLQQNVTGLLSSELDKEEQCGDRIALQNATLTPVEPAMLVIVQFHYERWACAKVFGTKEVKRLIGGNAVLQLKLTPVVEEDQTELQLLAEVGPIQADGSLGELLRSGALGNLVRDKIQKAITEALKKGTDLGATLPRTVQGYVKIKNAEFKDGGGGRLLVVLEGEVQVTDDQLQALGKELKEKVASHGRTSAAQ